MSAAAADDRFGLRRFADDGQSEPLTNRSITAVDRYVGARIRMCRHENGLSLEQLAKRLGITFQQLQKYERGIARISASRLERITIALRVPLTYFFDGMAKGAHGLGAEAAPSLEALADPGLVHLVAVFARITDPHLRKEVVEMVEAIAAEGSSSTTAAGPG